jgi:hypothetical protein
MSPEQRHLLERISDLEHSRTELQRGQQAAANDIRRIVSVLEVLAGYLGIPLPPGAASLPGTAAKALAGPGFAQVVSLADRRAAL